MTNNMNDNSLPIQSTRTLLKATLIATLLASALFVTIVLPAEYNIDITGVGKQLGLTELSGEVASAIPQQPVPPSLFPYREDETIIVVPAKKGLEYKFHLQQYGNLSYEWKTNGPRLYLDFHGEPQGDTTGYFESYTAATSSEMKGSLMTPFEGAHGWYWQNTSDEDITVILKTQGTYQVIGLK